MLGCFFSLNSNNFWNLIPKGMKNHYKYHQTDIGAVKFIALQSCNFLFLSGHLNAEPSFHEQSCEKNMLTCDFVHAY